MNEFGGLTPTLEQVDMELHPLFYEHGSRLFVVGGQELALDDPDLERQLHFTEGGGVDKREITKYPVLLGVWGNPLTTPKFYTWLAESGRAADFTGTSKVMKEVFEEVHGQELKGRHHDEMHPLGFSAGLLREGHINLTVLGSCACLGTNPDGHIVDWNEWDSGFTELAFHNIDSKPQMVSIMAGLGHLALRCAEDTTTHEAPADPE